MKNHTLNQSMAKCMQIWLERKLIKLFLSFIPMGMESGKMMEPKFTAAQRPLKQWMTASNSELILKSRHQKMADFWSIENVWSIVKGKIASKTTYTLQQLKKEIIIALKEIDSDKDLCRKLVNSIPKRAEAIIKKNGSPLG